MLRYTLIRFQMYNTESSTVVTTLYIRSSELIHLVTETLYLLTKISILPLPGGNYYSTLCFYEFNFFVILHVSETIQYLSRSDLSHLA